MTYHAQERASIRLRADFSSKIMKAPKEWSGIIKVLGEKNYQKIFYIYQN